MKRSLLLTFVPAIIIVILSSCSIFDTSGGRAKGRGSYNCSEGNIRFDGDGLCYPSCTEGSLAWTDENHVSVGCMSTTPCVTNSDCGPNQICTQSGNCYTPVQSFCLENDDCPLGTLCEVATGTCKECLINSDCPAGQTCDINSGTCINSGGGTGTGDTTAPSISSKVLTLSSSMFPLTIAWTNATDDNSPLLYRVVSCTGPSCNLDSSDDGTVIQDWAPSIVSHTVNTGNNGLAYTFNVFVKDPANNISCLRSSYKTCYQPCCI